MRGAFSARAPSFASCVASNCFLAFLSSAAEPAGTKGLLVNMSLWLAYLPTSSTGSAKAHLPEQGICMGSNLAHTVGLHLSLQAQQLRAAAGPSGQRVAVGCGSCRRAAALAATPAAASAAAAGAGLRPAAEPSLRELELC